MILLALTPGPVPRARVLLVEDHFDTRQMYAEYLRLTFDVLEAGDGAEALRLAAAHGPDVIVTDVSLPGMDGVALIAQLRGAPRTARVPIITLSGYGRDLPGDKAGVAGADRTMMKPCLPDALAAAITDLLAPARRRSTP